VHTITQKITKLSLAHLEILYAQSFKNWLLLPSIDRTWHVTNWLLVIWILIVRDIYSRQCGVYISDMRLIGSLIIIHITFFSEYHVYPQYAIWCHMRFENDLGMQQYSRNWSDQCWMRVKPWKIKLLKTTRKFYFFLLNIRMQNKISKFDGHTKCHTRCNILFDV
jgi:hypothetical protein